MREENKTDKQKKLGGDKGRQCNKKKKIQTYKRRMPRRKKGQIKK